MAKKNSGCKNHARQWKMNLPSCRGNVASPYMPSQCLGEKSGFFAYRNCPQMICWSWITGIWPPTIQKRMKDDLPAIHFRGIEKFHFVLNRFCRSLKLIYHTQFLWGRRFEWFRLGALVLLGSLIQKMMPNTCGKSITLQSKAFVNHLYKTSWNLQ